MIICLNIFELLCRLCGSYDVLKGGSQTEAMEDFTGGLCEKIKLNDKDRPTDLYKQMLKFQKQSSLMGCAIEVTYSSIENNNS